MHLIRKYDSKYSELLVNNKNMNTNHYPSLDLCKKLTEAGFPETDQIQVRSVWRYVTWPNAGQWFEFKIQRRPRPWDPVTCDCKEEYYCPSVMELLDKMPKDYSDTFVSSFKITIDMRNEEQWATISVTKNGATNYEEFTWTFPNALASMWLWLKENNYLP